MSAPADATILTVEDEPAQLELLSYHLGKIGFRVVQAEDGEEADRVGGLDTGADEYAVKPYSVNVLLAQVRKVSPTEFRLLSVFIERPGRVWSCERLLDRVLGIDSEIDFRTVDIHVGRLRKALHQTGEPDPIRTVRGTGYWLDFNG